MTSPQPKFWQLQEFSRNVDVHYTTLNIWSNLLENKRVHYINRAKGSNKKVYDELDLQIFKYIKSKRDEGWNLEAITDMLPDEMQDLRPFPEDFFSDNQVITSDQIKQEVFLHLSRLFEDHQNDILELLNQRTEEIAQSIDRLPKPNDPEIERANRVNQMITEHRIKSSLEVEALEEWAKLPESDRYKKVGLFRKEEDHYKRERFIREYVNQHYAERLKKEFDVE